MNKAFSGFLCLTLSITLLFSFLVFSSCSSKTEEDIIKLYTKHIIDLENMYTAGYKNIFSEKDEQGLLLKTERTLDCAILGDGFFKLYDLQKDITFYSRSGRFEINKERYLTDHNGYLLFPKVQFPVTYIRNSITMVRDGLLRYKTTDSENIKTIRIYLYNDTSGTHRVEGIYYHFVNPARLEDIQIVQSYIEVYNYNRVQKVLSIQELLFKLKEYDKKNRFNLDFKIKVTNALLEYLANLNPGSDNNNEVRLFIENYIPFLSLNHIQDKPIKY